MTLKFHFHLFLNSCAIMWYTPMACFLGAWVSFPRRRSVKSSQPAMGPFERCWELDRSDWGMEKQPDFWGR